MPVTEGGLLCGFIFNCTLRSNLFWVFLRDVSCRIEITWRKNEPSKKSLFWARIDLDTENRDRQTPCQKLPGRTISHDIAACPGQLASYSATQ